LVDGKPVYYWVNRQDMIIPVNAGYVALVNCTNITVKNSNLANNGQGVLLAYTTNSTIAKSNITENGDGIYLWSSNHNSISGNIITENNRYGIGLQDSPDNIISGNNIGNNKNAIFLSDSSNNTASGNNITTNKEYGIHISESSNSVISGNNMANNKNAIRLSMSSNTTVTRNNMTGNNRGILLQGCSGNTVFGNNIENNQYGILLLLRGTKNSIYHNNFITNIQQITSDGYPNAWDDGYPSGGNYWSDYGERYPSAEELDGSGIWDTPYEIDENNQDNYPLTEPWSPTPPVPTTIGELKTKIEELGSEGEIDNQGIVKSLIAKLNVAQKLVDKGKIDEAKSILEEDFIPQVQNLTDIHLTPEAADLLIQSAEYILSNL